MIFLLLLVKFVVTEQVSVVVTNKCELCVLKSVDCDMMRLGVIFQCLSSVYVIFVALQGEFDIGCIRNKLS